MNQPMQTISFRLPIPFARQLAQQGAEHNQSSGEYARQLVTEALADVHREELRTELAAVRDAVQRLREDLATIAAALLVNAGKATAAQAEEWVRTTLLEQGRGS